MQFASITTDPAKDYGADWAWRQHTASLPATVQDGEVQDGWQDEAGTIPNMVPNMVPNPAIFANAYDYAAARVGAMIASAFDSWCAQADAANAMPPSGEPGGVTMDWRPQAVTDLELYAAARAGILSTLLSYYQQGGQADYATAVYTAMAQVRDIDTSPAIVAVVSDPAGTRAQFDAAVLAEWQAIAGAAPAQVRSDFAKFGGKAL